MELAREVGVIQQEVDELFERLEIATEKDDEVVAEYQLKLDELEV